MDNNQKQFQDLIKNEAVRVELASRAGGYVTRNLVKKAEEMLASSTYANRK